MAGTDSLFAGSIPQLYESHLVPLIFEPYAEDLARRVVEAGPERVLEIACGTGVVTRRLFSTLAAGSRLIGSDLNPAMLAEAARRATKPRPRLAAADAQALPFRDGRFDAVVCQFGAMFFPSKVDAYRQMRRLLRPGGALFFNVWDRISQNEFADLTTRALSRLFPDDPPGFLARTPHGYHDPDRIARELAEAGFGMNPEIVFLEARSRAADPRRPAVAYCEGTPLRREIEARAPGRLREATDAASAEIERTFGSGPVDGKIRALVIRVEK